MEGGNISAQSTPRVWVMEDVVLSREPVMAVTAPKKKRWRKAPAPVVEEAIVVNLAAMNILYRYMQRWASSGLKLEVVHIGDDRGQEILDLLDRSGGSAFTNVVCFPTEVAVADALAYRADVINIVDTDDRFMRFGSRGMRLGEVG